MSKKPAKAKTERRGPAAKKAAAAPAAADAAPAVPPAAAAPAEAPAAEAKPAPAAPAKAAEKPVEKPAEKPAAEAKKGADPKAAQAAAGDAVPKKRSKIKLAALVLTPLLVLGGGGYAGWVFYVGPTFFGTKLASAGACVDRKAGHGPPVVAVAAGHGEVVAEAAAGAGHGAAADGAGHDEDAAHGAVAAEAHGAPAEGHGEAAQGHGEAVADAHGAAAQGHGEADAHGAADQGHGEAASDAHGAPAEGHGETVAEVHGAGAAQAEGAADGAVIVVAPLPDCETVAEDGHGGESEHAAEGGHGADPMNVSSVSPEVAAETSATHTFALSVLIEDECGAPEAPLLKAASEAEALHNGAIVNPSWMAAARRTAGMTQKTCDYLYSEIEQAEAKLVASSKPAKGGAHH